MSKLSATIKKARKISKRVNLVDIIYVVIGALLSALSMACFLVPNKIAPGGLSGISTILYFVAKIPIGITLFGGNLALIILQVFIIGKGSAWKTLLSIGITSATVDWFHAVIPPLTTNPLLACLYGGLIAGVSIGLTFRAGGTTGGLDIISQILHVKFHIPVGDMVLLTNVAITILAGWVFTPELALYGLITVFVNSRVIDSVLEGMSVYRSVFIITKFPDEVSWAIIEDVHRGVTAFEGVGVYSAKPTKILLTAVSRKEMSLLRQIIYEYDPEAFVIVGDARQIIGKGFISLNDEVRFAKGN